MQEEAASPLQDTNCNAEKFNFKILEFVINLKIIDPNYLFVCFVLFVV